MCDSSASNDSNDTSGMQARSNNQDLNSTNSGDSARGTLNQRGKNNAGAGNGGSDPFGGDNNSAGSYELEPAPKSALNDFFSAKNALRAGKAIGAVVGGPVGLGISLASFFGELLGVGEEETLGTNPGAGGSKVAANTGKNNIPGSNTGSNTKTTDTPNTTGKGGGLNDFSDAFGGDNASAPLGQQMQSSQGVSLVKPVTPKKPINSTTSNGSADDDLFELYRKMLGGFFRGSKV